MEDEPTGGGDSNARTLDSYEAAAALYAAAYVSAPERLLEWMDRLAERLGEGARVLEIGSATGRDAEHLERRGLRVRRTDATEAFVSELRSRGLDAERLNVLTDDLRGPWDCIYANAVFLHLSPEQLERVLARTAAAVSPGGVLAFTVKEGDGAAWSSHKLGRPRHFTYWREGPLRELIRASPWELESLELQTGHRDDWIQCVCCKRGAAD